ncbi:HAMP domain-containing sensor histidine kinase [Clostridium sediminicola]|uniref:sensor histidine kinase n=1 Tax=Clostridium sediminicola TaxID=3114879 RepID=UPI0031F25484
MTIRKVWLYVIILVVIISVGVNATILTSLTDRYFKDYMTESYKDHISQIVQYTEKALNEKDISYNQMMIELETHLVDPIIRIRVYNPEGELLMDVDDDNYMGDMMMHGKMMREMMNSFQNEVEQYTVKSGNEIVGILNITKYSSAENSFVARMFKSSLLMNSLLAALVAIILSIIIGYFVSKKMSMALKDTADMAQDIQFGCGNRPKGTTITEINTIRESLESLNTRLKLKQKSRKALIDELVHQSRTPLTVLKTHLEAIEDGIVEMNDEEIRICQNQISNISSIISNMSGMIDAASDIDELRIESFELNQLIIQITSGLKAQFNKKNINLEVTSNKKIIMETDKYKLSQVIYNILTNAYKYTNNGGSVEVNYKLNNEMMTIIIRDTGIGIDKKDIEKIFNAYYRSNLVKNTTGEGIGLYIVKKNLERINATIIVESKKNIGSNFVIRVPIKL